MFLGGIENAKKCCDRPGREQSLRMLFEILLIVAVVVLLVVAAIALLVKFRPQALAPLGKLLMRSKRGREFAEKQTLKAAAANPEMISEMTEGLVGRKQAAELEKQLSSRSEDERYDVLEQATSLAQKGRIAEAQQLLQTKPRTGDQKRAQAKRKSKARAKSKQARAARKRNR